jgi:hypothetical protein
MKSHFDGKPDTRLYSIMPARAIQDDKMHGTTLRVLGAICLHANKYGIAWPSRTTLGRHVSRDPRTISRHTARLVQLGYLRRLDPRRYPVPRKGAGYTSRFQVLYEGPKTAMPTKEQFYAAKPRVIAEIDDELPVVHKSEGVRGIDADLLKRIARAFCAAVERSTGQARVLEQQLEDAAPLAAAGTTPEQVADYTVSMCLERRTAGRSAPLRLKQVADWAGLG